MELSFEELIEVIGGEIILENENHNFNNICTDTRKVTKDNVFLALNGESFNGNKFAIEALKKGASIAIIDETLATLKDAEGLGVIIKVKNSYDALIALAKYYRKKLNLKVVSVTGSTGKTSTKDLIAAFLSSKYKVFKTKGNFNNHIGMPLMILELDSSYDVAVLELGMSNLGEIHELASCARPDIAVITNIGLSHIENLKSQDNILKAKMEIVDFFDDKNVLIVNGEDSYLEGQSTKEYKLIKTGYKDTFDYKGKNIKINNGETEFSIEDNNKIYDFKLPMVGAHNVLNALLAIGVSRELGVTFLEMIEGINNIEATSMRLEIINNEKFTIINDCYNASPDSMKAALDVLESSKGKRKVAILGTMKELGEESKSSHEFVGNYAKNKTDLLIVTGEWANSYKLGYGNNNILVYNSKEEVISNIKNIIKDGDIILVKASRSIKFEDIINELLKSSF